MQIHSIQSNRSTISAEQAERLLDAHKFCFPAERARRLLQHTKTVEVERKAAGLALWFDDVFVLILIEL